VALPSCRDKSAALNDLTEQHRKLQTDTQGLGGEIEQLRAALAASQQQGEQAEHLGVSLQAQYAGAQEAQAVLQEEVERLTADLQQVGPCWGSAHCRGWPPLALRQMCACESSVLASRLTHPACLCCLLRLGCHPAMA